MGNGRLTVDWDKRFESQTKPATPLEHPSSVHPFWSWEQHHPQQEIILLQWMIFRHFFQRNRHLLRMVLYYITPPA